MKPLEQRDYFTDHSVLRDPYSWFEAIRAKGPVYRHPDSGIIFVTGFAETLEVLNNTKDFSSAIAPQGPAVPLPFQPSGDDLTPQIEAHRTSFQGGDLLVAYDDAQHTRSRQLLSTLFTPKRLKANEDFISELADKLVREAVAKGGCELIKEIATPFVTLVIADLLGVPPADRQVFMDAIEAGPPPGSLDASDLEAQHRPLIIMGTYFFQYVTARRENPTTDVLSELSNAKYQDGTIPDPLEIVRLAVFLFGAGQDTSAKLLGNAMRLIVETPGLQQKLRDDRSLIPLFIEEVLRIEGSTKMTARLARRNTKIGDVDVPVGTKVFVGLAAANRDPRRWESPDTLIVGREKNREHLAFGRGQHVCAGSPLARAEIRIVLERFLDHTSNIDLDESVHGPRGNRHLNYEASFIIRGLEALHLKLS